jgi:hypothetical protein
LVYLLLLFVKLLSLAGCELRKPDGTEVNLDTPGPIFVGVGSIADNQPAGLLSTFTTVDVISVDPGMA